MHPRGIRRFADILRAPRSPIFRRSLCAVVPTSLVLPSSSPSFPSAPVAVAEEKAEANAAGQASEPTGQSPQEPPYTAAPLPTVQIDGVAWGQLVVGDVVYVVGEFHNARPAGAPKGQQEVPRSNILAYDLNTGELIEDFAPSLNGAGRSLAVSQDGKTLYVAGEFDQVNGEAHSRMAAFDISHGHGTLISSFRPKFNTVVKDIAVAGDTVYVGGFFTKVNDQKRVRLAALKASTGELLSWTASALTRRSMRSRSPRTTPRSSSAGPSPRSTARASPATGWRS